VDRDDLAGAWATLQSWVASRTGACEHELERADRAVAAARSRLAEHEASVLALLAGHGVCVPAGRPVAQAAEPAVAAELERARSALARVAERRRRAAELAARRASAHEAHLLARSLAGLLRSDAFPRWLVATALDVLVADASTTLARLTGGQFSLAHDGGEFLVVDHADADTRRPVKTLSGGETFQASLALALALSAQVSTMASAGAPKLESIFLDEGFGTLDDATLDTVAATLENLAAESDRMVGVVTHTATLAERVPVRFAVSRDHRTSAVAREG
jgi:exonuclease SbcC